MGDHGLAVKGESGSRRLEIECEHQSGVLYVVPSEANWVCPEELLHVHALAGFFGELVRLNDPDVTETMQRWGLYFRERELASREQEGEEPD